MLRLGPFVLRAYAALVDFGLLLGALLIFLASRRQRLDRGATIDVALVGGMGALVLGRAAYVGVHWAYYAHHLRHAVLLWEGGLLWQGALLGGLIGASVACALRGLPLLPVLDALAPGAACAAVFGWLACFVVGCAWGLETHPGQGLLSNLSLDAPNLYGVREPRVAVQLMGAAWSGIVLVAVLLTRRYVAQPGIALGLWIALHSVGSLALGFLRADPMPLAAGWRIDQLANLALSVAGIGLLGGLVLARRAGARPRLT